MGKININKNLEKKKRNYFLNSIRVLKFYLKSLNFPRNSYNKFFHI